MFDAEDSTKTGLAVIESKWHGAGLKMRKNASVRPMFDMLCDLHFGNSHEYLYEMVGTVPALKEAIDRLIWSDEISTLYIAAHGSKDGLHLHGEDQVVSRSKLCNMLWGQGSRRRSLTGLYLGSCEFGTREVADFILARDRQLRWVAGYTHASNFVDGTALDVMFFNSWLRALEREGTDRPRDVIESVAEELRVTCAGLIRTRGENGYEHDDEEALGMGFSVYVRAKGPSGGIVDLLRPEA